MKKLVLILLYFCFAVNSFSQKPLTYSVVIEKEGADAQSLYDWAKLWCSRTYIDTKAVANEENSNKELTGDGKIDFSTGMMYSSIQGIIKYSVDIQFKDGRLLFEMSNFTHEPSFKGAYFKNNMGILVDPLPEDLSEIGMESANSKMCYKYYYKKGKALCGQEFMRLSNDLKQFIDKRSGNNDDW